MSVLLIALLAVADPVSAAATPAAPAAPQEKAEKKICRVDTTESASRLRKRVCMTQTEWSRKEAGVTANDLKNVGAR